MTIAVLILQLLLPVIAALTGVGSSWIVTAAVCGVTTLLGAVALPLQALPLVLF